MDPVGKILGDDNIVECYMCDGEGLNKYGHTCKKCLGMGSYAKNP